MTNKKILKQVVWRDANEAQLECLSLLFGLKVEVQVLTYSEECIFLKEFAEHWR